MYNVNKTLKGKQLNSNLMTMPMFVIGYLKTRDHKTKYRMNFSFLSNRTHLGMKKVQKNMYQTDDSGYPSIVKLQIT